jgi:hypothetical protein
MTNLLTSKDFNDFNNHELKVAQAAVKAQIELRDKAFMSQFNKGINVAIKWDNGNNYPAIITKVNKKSIDILYIHAAIKDEKNILGRPVQTMSRLDIKMLKRFVRVGRIFKVTHGKNYQYAEYPLKKDSVLLSKDLV